MGGDGDPLTLQLRFSAELAIFQRFEDRIRDVLVCVGQEQEEDVILFVYLQIPQSNGSCLLVEELDCLSRFEHSP